MSQGRPAPTIRLRRLAAELRRHRRTAGLTREDVVARTGVNAATLYRIEAARVRPQPRTLAALLDAYAVDDPGREALGALLRSAGRRSGLHALAAGLPDHYASYIEFESEALELLTYQSLHVPGLLQTEDYARAVTRGTLPGASADEVGHRIRARLERQAAVLGGPAPLRLWAIVDEAALRRSVGGPAVMRAQLDHLLRAADSPTVTVQVVPFDAGAHPGLQGAFVLMGFAEPVGPDVVYLESQAGDLFLDDPSEVDRYRVAFDHLRAVALSPAASTTAIEKS